MITRYMPFDTETGGIPKGVSLLSLYLEVLDEKLNKLDSLYMFTKPNDGIYHVEAGGLEVNKINLVEHDKVAITYSEAGQKLFNFVNKNSDGGKTRLIPIGKQIHFDVDKVTENLLGKKTWDRFVSYRMIDVTGIAMAMQIKGKLPPTLGLSLFSLAEYFNVYATVVGNLHEADYDTKVTVAVFKELMALM